MTLGDMEMGVLMSAVTKMSDDGERVGLTNEQMIRLLNAGFTPDDLNALIEHLSLCPGPNHSRGFWVGGGNLLALLGRSFLLRMRH